MNDYTTWYITKFKLNELKESEKKLRLKLCNEIFKSGRTKFNLTTDSGIYKTKATPTTNLNVDKKILDEIWDDLTEEEKNMIKLEPSIGKTDFKNLPEDSLLLKAITEKPGMPKLEMELMGD